MATLSPNMAEELAIRAKLSCKSAKPMKVTKAVPSNISLDGIKASSDTEDDDDDDDRGGASSPWLGLET